MLVSCLPWRSSVFLSLTVFLGLGKIASSTTTTTATAADCASTGSTNTYLSDSIPPCALSCVQDFIRTQYAAGLCCSSEIDCLCRTNTTSGLTLGEAALACIVGSCPSDIVSTDGSVGYAICNDVSGALPETHGAITATRVSVVTETTHLASTTAASVPAKSTGVSTAPTTVVVSSTSDRTTLKTATKTTETATAATTLPIKTLTTSPITTTLTGITATTTTAASTAAAKPSSLSSPAVIGVSIASGVSAIFLVAVAIFFCGRRLRRKRLQAEAAPQSFEIGGEMSEPPDFTAAATVVPQPLPPTQPSQFPHGTTETEYSGGAHFQQFPSQPLARQQQGPLVVLTRSDADANANKAAMSPETDYNGSPQSQTSQRTLSRLLPERSSIQGIGVGIVPEPLRVIRQPPITNTIRVVGGPPPRPTSEATVFDEDEQQLNSNDVFGPPLDKTRRMSQRNTADGGSPMRVVGLPAGPRAMLSPLRTRQEQNPYDGTGNSGYYSYKWDKEAAPIPSASRSRRSQQYNSSGNWNSTPLQRNFSRLGSAPRSLTTPTKSKTYSPYSRNTNGFEVAPVDSSYETIMAEDDWTMTERSKLTIPSQVPRQSQQPQRLSPVSERIPLPTKSPLRYPAIPRSAAEAIVPATAQGMRKSHVAEVYYDNPQSLPSMPPPPKSNNNSNFPNPMSMVYELGPGQRSRSASPSSSVNSSLLAKRRGESVADKMESQFRSGVQPKPTISRKVVVARNGQPSTTGEEVQSPPSAKKHNITPTRRGEDLYLRVD